MKWKTVILGTVIIVTIFTAAAWGGTVVPVSPGGGTEVTSQTCPTFSWSAADHAVAYRIEGSTVSYLSGGTAAGDTLTIPGSPGQAAYYVADSSGLRTPVIATARPDTNITSGNADFLIIAHPDFVSGIQPLADA